MENRLFYTAKATHFEEALPLGNGRLGATVFGNLKTERIALNEDTLWSGYPRDVNKKDAHLYLEELRQAIFCGDHDRAEAIANTDMRGEWSEGYLPFGDLIIAYKGEKGAGYRRTLDIAKGIAEAENTALKQMVFVSHPAQLIAVHIESEKGVSVCVKLTSKLRHRVAVRSDCLLMEGRTPEICRPSYYSCAEPVVYGDKGMPFCAAVKAAGDAVFDKDCIRAENVRTLTLYISLATGFVDYRTVPDADATQRALAYLKNIKPYEQLLEEHVRDFSALFDRVALDFGTERADLPTDKRLKRFQAHPEEDSNLAALLFQYGRYLTISASRSGTQAMNLQGIFNEHLRAPWSSNYTTNINAQMNYWCTDAANLSECFEPYLELVKRLVENGRATAQDYYGCRGACAHHNSDIWAMTRPAGDPLGEAHAQSYAPWCMALPWMLAQVYEHFRYQKDKSGMEALKPYFREVLDFYEDFLTEHEGAFVTCPSISPENTYLDGGRKANLTYMPTMDIGILQEFFADCRALGMETPPIGEIPIGSDGRIMEWCREYGEAEPQHRHVSHLYCVFPSAIRQSEAVHEACRQSLLGRGFGGTGWSLGWKVCLWARLGDADKAMTLIKNQLYPIRPGMPNNGRGGSYPNLLDAHPPFQIDGNFGVTAGIAELLKNKTVPKEWNGYAKGLRLYDGEILNISFRNGEVTD